MSTVALFAALRSISPAERKTVIAELLNEELRESEGDPVAVVNRSNDTLGYFVPFSQLNRKPAQPTDRERAELHRRGGLVHDAVPVEQVIPTINSKPLR